MPPLRRTPMAKAATYNDLDEDHGFNPAWAVAPDPIQYSRASQHLRTPQPSSGGLNPFMNATQNPFEASTISKPMEKPAGNGPGTDEDTGLDMVTYAAMAPLAAAWYLINGASTVVQKGVTGTLALAGAIRGPPKPARFDPLARNKRPARGAKASKGSMLELPPHMVGATPNVVRVARGDRKRGKPGFQTPTIAEARDWQLFHATPLPKPPKFENTTPVRSTVRQNTAPNTPFVTPKFEFNTPQRKIKIGKAKEFAHNVHKSDINTWLKLLHKHGIRTSALRTNWAKQFQLPTDGILNMARSRKDLPILAKAFCHQGFLTHCKLQLPSAVNPEPTVFRKNQPNISLSSVAQQRDGCCRFCRGFSWAGQHEVRQVAEDGTVPVRSHHKSVKPYTSEETAEFELNKFDMLFRRWCQESRYDWVFQEPHLKKDSHGQFTWRIPGDDPRLRHIAMMKQQHSNAIQAKKMYNADLTQERNTLIEDLSRQDIASKLLLDAIHKENPEMAKKYRALDLERKRRQVHTEWLCVKQVKLMPAVASKTDATQIQLGNSRKRRANFNEPDVIPAKRSRAAGRSVRWAPNLETNAPSDKPATSRNTPARGILKTAAAPDINQRVPSSNTQSTLDSNNLTKENNVKNRSQHPTNPLNVPTPDKQKPLFTRIPGFDPVRIRQYEQKGFADPEWDRSSNSSQSDKGGDSDAKPARKKFHFSPSSTWYRGNSAQQGNPFSLNTLSPEPSSSSSLLENSKEPETNEVPCRDLTPSQSGSNVSSGSWSIVPDADHLNNFLSVSTNVYDVSSRQLESITTFMGDILRPWVSQSSPKCSDPIRNLYQKVTDLSLARQVEGSVA